MARFFDDSKRRLRDFQRVWAKDAYSCEYGSYWNVHPFADETEILERIEMKLEECVSVDLWWNYETDVALVTIDAGTPSSTLDVGVFGSERPYPRIFAEITDSVVRRSDVPDILKQALDQGLKKKDFLKRSLRGA